MIGKHIGIDLPYDDEITVVQDALQQEAGLVDCSVVILYGIHKHINHELAVKCVSKRELKTMQANIVNALLL